MSLRKRIEARTANLPALKDIELSRRPEDKTFPETAVGLMAVLSETRLRIEELEAQIIGMGGTVPFAEPDWSKPSKRHLEEARARVTELESLAASIATSSPSQSRAP